MVGLLFILIMCVGGRKGFMGAMSLETKRGCHDSRVMGDCELYNVGARNWTQIFQESRIHSYSLSHLAGAYMVDLTTYVNVKHMSTVERRLRLMGL